MRLRFENFNGRGRKFRPIVDEDTGQEVGYIQSNGTGTIFSGGISVSLFDEKYQTTVNTLDRARGFIKGVEAVLSHLTFVKGTQTKSAAADMRC